MKKQIATVLALTFCMSCLCACSKEEPVTTTVPSEVTTEAADTDASGSAGKITGGWQINGDMPVMNDASFDEAAKDHDGMTLEPLQPLATQVVAGMNTKYLAYGTSSAASAEKELKIVTVYKDLEGKSSVTEVTDFNIAGYTADNGSVEDNGAKAGGWSVNKELPNMLDDECKAYFSKAMDGLVGVDYTPVCLLGTQVVAGTNYAILAEGTPVVMDAQTNLYVITIYVDLEGNASILNICGVDVTAI